MKVKDVIAEFSVKVMLPIDLADVEAAIRRHGVPDDEEIYYFHDVDIPADAMNGFIHSENVYYGKGPNGDDDWRTIHTITYAKGGDEMERLVCCKEMLHILDPIEFKAKELADVDKLISDIILAPDAQGFANNGHHAIWDKVTILHAIAILMPLACVELFRPTYKAGKISLQRVAEIAEIPAFAVAIAMHDEWSLWHARLIRKPERHIM